MRRILHIIPTLGGGGAERQLVNLVSHTSADKFDHYVCVFEQAEFFAPAIREAGFEVKELGVSGKHPWLSATRKISKIVREYKPDVICTWLYDAGIVGRMVHLRHSGIPLICTLHLTQYEPETIQGGNWSPTRVEGLRLIDWVTNKITNQYFAACSEEVKNSYCRTLGIDPSEITTIYNGIDPEYLKIEEGAPQKIRRELGISDDDFVYLSVGRLAPQKNYPHLLTVFKKVVESIPNARLAIVGDGDIENDLKNLANSLNIADKVYLLGRRTDIGACLEMADVFVMPSLFEGMPLALLEAMFKRLPCIVSRIKVLEEAITENESGLLIDPIDSTDLHDAMVKLYREPELRERFGGRALEVAEQRFHIRTIASQWENFYDKVLSENKIK